MSNFMTAVNRWLGPTPVNRTPLTPAQLDSYRPKPPAPEEQSKQLWPGNLTAKQFAYRCGIKDIEYLCLRIEALEAERADFLKQFEALVEALPKVR
jgi:hypothetical protein